MDVENYSSKMAEDDGTFKSTSGKKKNNRKIYKITREDLIQLSDAFMIDFSAQLKQ